MLSLDLPGLIFVIFLTVNECSPIIYIYIYDIKIQRKDQQVLWKK